MLLLSHDSCVQKVQLPKELDADFGCFFPTDIKSYVITIFSRQPLDFLLLIPNMKRTKSVIQEVMLNFFEKGDKYLVKDASDQDIQNFETNKYHLPILSYDPNTLLDDKISFFWLVPPIYLRQ